MSSLIPSRPDRLVSRMSGGTPSTDATTPEALPLARAVPKAVARSTKSRAMAAILAVFLGQLGIHRFYAGRMETGVVMVTLAIVGYASYFLFVVGIFFVATVVVWNILDIVKILLGRFRDGQGRRLVNWMPEVEAEDRTAG